MNTQDRINNYTRLFNQLDATTQTQLNNFLAGIEEVGQNFGSGTHYNGPEEFINKVLPCLQALSPSITSLKINLLNGTYYHKLEWECRDFVLPSNVLVHEHEEHEVEEFDDDSGNLLVRTRSAPSQYQEYEDDSVPSVVPSQYHQQYQEYYEDDSVPSRW